MLLIIFPLKLILIALQEGGADNNIEILRLPGQIQI